MIEELKNSLIINEITMTSRLRLDNTQYCIEEVLKHDIIGHVIETGVWRGGSSILMRAVLKEYNVVNRKVFVADSFNGFPEPKFNWDKGATFLDDPMLKVSVDEVKRNFEKYGLLDNQVEFVEGYFSDTLPKINEVFSVIRLDGDLFESTIDALINLYHKLSVGGYVIIDDYGLECCSQAVNQFRNLNNITERIIQIDEFGVYWKKEK
jgi:O-methyltransferase